MKIYFSASISGGRQQAAVYPAIVAALQPFGTVLTEFVADPAQTDSGEKGSNEDIYNRDLALLQQADVVVAEVSVPSFGVGVEIALAGQWGKPVLALVQKSGKRLSAMISGDPNVAVVEYDGAEQIASLLPLFFQQNHP